MNKIRRGKYRHYKGKFYEVFGVARHSETLEEFVVYEALYKTRFGKTSLWIRSRKMFEGTVKIGGKAVKRFQEFKVNISKTKKKEKKK